MHQFFEIYQNVKSEWENQALLFPFNQTALAKLLFQSEPPNPWFFFETYFSSWTWNRLWLKSCMTDAAIKTSFNQMLILLDELKKNKLYTEINVMHVFCYENPTLMVRAFIVLSKAGHISELDRVLDANHKNPYSLASGLVILAGAELLDDENFSRIVKHENPYLMARALARLHQASILNEINLARMANRENPCLLADAFSFLAQAGLLNERIAQQIILHENTDDLLRALTDLAETPLFIAENIDKLLTHVHAIELARTLSDLAARGLLTPPNFNSLLQPNHAVLLTPQACEVAWDRIPHHLFTQMNIQRLIRASEHPEPYREIERVMDQILGVGHGAEMNSNQSIHTASVHQTASESAKKLKAYYFSKFDLNCTIDKIQTFVNGQESNIKNDAAKRCLARLLDGHFTYIDKASNTTVRELLALTYFAIHDDAKRQDCSGVSVSLVDAKALFIQALYEIQRGYNLNAQDIDNGQQDIPICAAGTFIKLVEKLSGIHIDVRVDIITHEGACHKFTKLTQAHILSYLEAQVSPKTIEAYQEIRCLLERLKSEEGIAVIWEHIQSSIEEELWSEYKIAYDHNRKDSRFRGIVDSWMYCELPDLSNIEGQLRQSMGYQEYLGRQAQVALLQNSLWEHQELTLNQTGPIETQHISLT